MARSPLFDYYDPYGELDMQAQMGMLPPDEDDLDEFGLPRQRKKATLSDLLPEEEKSTMLGRLANMGASGLTGLGYLLDTPGAAVRGILAGKPLSVFGSAEERVTGRDLLRQMGMAGDEDNWANWTAGLAGEIILDPLSYLNPLAILGRGAYGAGGRAMQRAGLLENVKLLARKQNKGVREFLRTTTPDQLFGSHLLPNDSSLAFARAARAKGLDPDVLGKQPMAGLMEARLPFTERGALLSGGAAGDMLARGLDQFGDALSRSPLTAPVVNRLTRAFDPTVMERLNVDDQWRAREAFAEYTANARDFRERVSNAYLGARRAADGFDDPSIQNAIVDSIEAMRDPDRLARLPADAKAAIAQMEAVPEWAQYRNFLVEELSDQQQRMADLGISMPYLPEKDGLGYFPRQKARFAKERIPKFPGRGSRPVRAYDRGSRVYTVDDLVGEARRPYLREFSRSDLRQLMAGTEGGQLRDRMFGAKPAELPGILDEAFTNLGMPLPYERLPDADGHTIESLRAFLSDPSLSPIDRAAPEKALQALETQAGNYKTQLGELLRTVDRNFSDAGMGLFDRHTMADMMRSGVGNARSHANAKVLLDSLQRMAMDRPANLMPGGGAVNLLDAAGELGFNKGKLKEILEARMPGMDINNLSINQSDLAELKAVAPRMVSDPSSLSNNFWNSFTNAFKIGALANPSYHTRNLYSGFLSSLSSGQFNPLELGKSFYAGLQAGRGNYDGVVARLKNTAGFQGISDPKELIDEFLVQGSRNPLGQGLINETEGQVRNAAQNTLIGMDPQEPLRMFGQGGLLYDPSRTWSDWSTIKGVDFAGIGSGRAAPAETLNPFLRLHERAGRRIEDANRIGTFIEALRQGFSPDAASDLVFKTQVHYAPEAFTQFERQLKQAIPFYSYTRGIAPSVIDNILYRPGGLQGQVTRAISNVARPSEDQFVPEHLRATASVPLPFRLGEDQQLQRYLTNIDVPWAGLANFISPGTGNNAVERLTSGIQKTGLNLMGQLNPLIKAPLELLMDRQLYTGREMSDLYSMLEQDIGPIGRPLEQLLVNAPGGSRLTSIVRTARDSRMTPQERALKLLVNNFAGVKLTDVDEERSKSLAARNMLNELLRTTGGVRSYENITVPDEALATLPPEKRDMYLLYRVLQSDAAKRARRRKQEEMDPMEALLGGLR